MGRPDTSGMQNRGWRPMEVPGKELVERAMRKDAEAFAVLIRTYERVALSVAFGVLGEASAAGDATQEAFIRAWERLVWHMVVRHRSEPLAGHAPTPQARRTLECQFTRGRWTVDAQSVGRNRSARTVLKSRVGNRIAR
jgi:hypothetical protein